MTDARRSRHRRPHRRRRQRPPPPRRPPLLPRAPPPPRRPRHRAPPLGRVRPPLPRPRRHPGRRQRPLTRRRRASELACRLHTSTVAHAAIGRDPCSPHAPKGKKRTRVSVLKDPKASVRVVCVSVRARKCRLSERATVIALLPRSQTRVSLSQRSAPHAKSKARTLYLLRCLARKREKEKPLLKQRRQRQRPHN